MRCPECGSEAKTNELYCRVCGTEIRLTYDEVHATVSEEILRDKETATEDTMRNIALWMAFFLISAMTVDCASTKNLVSAEKPDQAYHLPVYSTRNELVRVSYYEDKSTDTIQEVNEQVERNKARFKGK